MKDPKWGATHKMSKSALWRDVAPGARPLAAILRAPAVSRIHRPEEILEYVHTLPYAGAQDLPEKIPGHRLDLVYKAQSYHRNELGILYWNDTPAMLTWVRGDGVLRVNTCAADPIAFKDFVHRCAEMMQMSDFNEPPFPYPLEDRRPLRVGNTQVFFSEVHGHNRTNCFIQVGEVRVSNMIPTYGLPWSGYDIEDRKKEATRCLQEFVVEKKHRLQIKRELPIPTYVPEVSEWEVDMAHGKFWT